MCATVHVYIHVYILIQQDLKVTTWFKSNITPAINLKNSIVKS